MLEKDIQRKILKGLRDLGGYAVKIAQNQFTPRGTPDILCCFDGLFYGIEVKRPGGKLSENQKMALAEIKDAGGRAFGATSWEDVLDAMFDGWRESPEDYGMKEK